VEGGVPPLHACARETTLSVTLKRKTNQQKGPFPRFSKVGMKESHGQSSGAKKKKTAFVQIKTGERSRLKWKKGVVHAETSRGIRRKKRVLGRRVEKK